MGDVSGDRRRNFFAEGNRLDLTMRFLLLPIVVLVVVTAIGFLCVTCRLLGTRQKCLPLGVSTVREIGSVVTWRLGCAGLGLGWYCVGVRYTVPATKATPSTYPGTHAWPCTSTNKSPAINRRYLLRSSGNTTITIRHNHNRD